MKTKRTVIVQCRLSSNRLPEKAIKMLGGKPVLAWVLAAMHKIKADRYFVATDEASYPILKKITSPSFTIYSFPSILTSPLFFAFT